jgi:photosystem II stability/assembly factor-like uncharacterized protein
MLLMASAGPWVTAAPARTVQTLRLAPIPPHNIPIESVRGAQADRPDRLTRAPRVQPALPTLTLLGEWRPLGPAPIGKTFSNFLAGGGAFGIAAGRVTGVAETPSGLHPKRVVAATAGGGIWTSDNEGTQWEPRTDGAADLAIGSVTDDPSEPNHLIAGTGEANQCLDCYPGTGILVSADAGDTWTLQNPGGAFNGLDIGQVAIDPSKSEHEFAATVDPAEGGRGGLYVTTNGGATWEKPTDSTYKPLDGNINSVVIDPKTPSTVYIGGGPGVIGKSTDGGVHWAIAKTGITAPSGKSLTALAIAPSSPSTLYASVGSEEPVALYKTVNGAESWSPLTKAPDYTGESYSNFGLGSGGFEQGFYYNVLAVDPKDPEHLVAGGIALVETKNGGTEWVNVDGGGFFTQTPNALHPDQHALWFRGDGKVWVGDDGGVFLDFPGVGVQNVNGNLNVTQFYHGFGAVEGTVLAGSQDNASARGSEPSEPWTGIWEGDGGSSAITPNEPETQLVEADQSLGITNDAFASESRPRNITPPAQELGKSELFVPPMIVVPNNTVPKDRLRRERALADDGPVGLIPYVDEGDERGIEGKRDRRVIEGTERRLCRLRQRRGRGFDGRR